jgi:hypothetical protein
MRESKDEIWLTLERLTGNQALTCTCVCESEISNSESLQKVVQGRTA